MRMFAQDAAFYRRVGVDETDHPEALRRLKQLEAIDRMRERFTLAEARSALELGRSTCYERKRRLREKGVKGWFRAAAARRATSRRQWTKADARRVLAVRREKPQAGKATLAHDGAERWPEHTRGEATVGASGIARWRWGGRSRARSAKGGWVAAKQRCDAGAWPAAVAVGSERPSSMTATTNSVRGDWTARGLPHGPQRRDAVSHHSA